MTEQHPLKQLVQKALAFAHAALEEPTPHYVIEAKRYAEAVLPHIERWDPRPVGLGEAHELFALVGQLRAVMALLERRLATVPARGN